MHIGAERVLNDLIERYPKLEAVKAEIAAAYEALKTCYDNGGKLMVAGNGGSYADAEHIAGELMKGFYKKRPLADDIQRRLREVDPEMGDTLAVNLETALTTVVLAGNQGINTAFSNDVDAKYIFAQQLMGYVKPHDVFLAISTSGNSKNILYAAIAAKAAGIPVIGLTGKNGGRLKDLSDIAIIVPANEAHTVQELHLPVYHALCLMLEDTYFDR